MTWETSNGPDSDDGIGWFVGGMDIRWRCGDSGCMLLRFRDRYFNTGTLETFLVAVPMTSVAAEKWKDSEAERLRLQAEAGTWSEELLMDLRVMMPCRCCETRFAEGGEQPTEKQRWGWM